MQSNYTGEACQECEVWKATMHCRDCGTNMCTECDNSIHNKGKRRLHKRTRGSMQENPETGEEKSPRSSKQAQKPRSTSSSPQNQIPSTPLHTPNSRVSETSTTEFVVRRPSQSDEIVETAWFHKRDIKITIFRKRMFVLRSDGTLKYYADDVHEHPNATPKGVIQLSAITRVYASSSRRHKFLLNIETPGRTYILSGDETIRDSWLTLLDDMTNRMDGGRQKLTTKQRSQSHDYRRSRPSNVLVRAVTTPDTQERGRSPTRPTTVLSTPEEAHEEHLLSEIDRLEDEVKKLESQLRSAAVTDIDEVVYSTIEDKITEFKHKRMTTLDKSNKQLVEELETEQQRLRIRIRSGSSKSEDGKEEDDSVINERDQNEINKGILFVLKLLDPEVKKSDYFDPDSGWDGERLRRDSIVMLEEPRFAKLKKRNAPQHDSLQLEMRTLREELDDKPVQQDLEEYFQCIAMEKRLEEIQQKLCNRQLMNQYPVSKWNCDVVAEWVYTLGDAYKSYSSLFAVNGITGNVLLKELTEQDIVSLVSEEHAENMWTQLKKLREESFVDPERKVNDRDEAPFDEGQQAPQEEDDEIDPVQNLEQILEMIKDAESLDPADVGAEILALVKVFLGTRSQQTLLLSALRDFALSLSSAEESQKVGLFYLAERLIKIHQQNQKTLQTMSLSGDEVRQTALSFGQYREAFNDLSRTYKRVQSSQDALSAAYNDMTQIEDMNSSMSELHNDLTSSASRAIDRLTELQTFNADRGEMLFSLEAEKVEAITTMHQERERILSRLHSLKEIKDSTQRQLDDIQARIKKIITTVKTLNKRENEIAKRIRDFDREITEKIASVDNQITNAHESSSVQHNELTCVESLLQFCNETKGSMKLEIARKSFAYEQRTRQFVGVLEDHLRNCVKFSRLLQSRTSVCQSVINHLKTDEAREGYKKTIDRDRQMLAEFADELLDIASASSKCCDTKSRRFQGFLENLRDKYIPDFPELRDLVCLRRPSITADSKGDKSQDTSAEEILFEGTIGVKFDDLKFHSKCVSLTKTTILIQDKKTDSSEHTRKFVFDKNTKYEKVPTGLVLYFGPSKEEVSFKLLADAAELWRENLTAVFSSFKNQQLLDAVNSGHRGIVWSLLMEDSDEFRANSKVKDPSGDSALHVSILNGDLATTQCILAIDPDLSTENDAQKRTPLHYAALGNHVEIVTMLLQHGADANTLDDNGWSPIDCSADDSLTSILSDNAFVDFSNRSSTSKQAPKSVSGQSGRDKVLHEIVETELTYVGGLQTLIACFERPLRMILPEDVLHDLFSNLPVLLKLHQGLYDDIEKMGNIPQVFVEVASYFKLYTDYVNGYDLCLKTLKDLQNNQKFHKFLKISKADITSLLITPIQRIPRYQLLLKELFRKTPPSHPEYGAIEKALSLIYDACSYVNESKRKFENRTNILGICQQYPTFLNPQRQFIMSDTLIKSINEEELETEALLFTDVLAYKSSLRFYKILSLNQFEVTEFTESENSKNGFELRNQFGHVHLFLCQNEQMMRTWMGKLKDVREISTETEIAVESQHARRKFPGVFF